jgi:hypothetical protein
MNNPAYTAVTFNERKIYLTPITRKIKARIKAAKGLAYMKKGGKGLPFLSLQSLA